MQRPSFSDVAATVFVALWLCMGHDVAAQDAAEQSNDGLTALDHYVAASDQSYNWQIITTINRDDYTAFVLELTSQTWRTKAEVDRPVWKHWLTVVAPTEVQSPIAFLYITHGMNSDPPPAQVDERSVRMALETNTVVGELRMVPNQMLSFADSKHHARQEDDLIAYSRVKYIMTGDETWLVRLPMVKSGVRAMDAITELLASKAAGEHIIDQFVVSGASKRGWTTWLVGIVDSRVIGMMPLVIDALNTEAITRHHYEAYGFFSASLGDYVRHGLYPHQLGSEKFKQILRIEDPFEYRHREQMKIPKYVINAAGDQYFLPDNSQYYFSQLPDQKLLRYVPNTKHNLADSDARESMIAFYDSLVRGRQLPEYSWQIQANGSIVVRSSGVPQAVNLWQAKNPDARDFRLDTIGAAWVSSPLKSDTAGRWIGKADQPQKGFCAYMVELIFDNGGRYPIKVTTDINVVPNLLPYKGEPMKPYLGRRPEAFLSEP